ncbi:MAG: hypothetical protein L6Q97_04025, partial [Thermoanaerobaculia bacterium]|nr:hypothetical protein [Thermoanaerobaculia bacterium]
MRTPLLLLLICLACSALAQTPHLVIPIGHSSDITAAAISPDEKYILTGSDDETAILWTIGGKEMYALKRHSGPIIAVAFLYNGKDKFALTADKDGAINQWNLSGNHIRTFRHAPPYKHGRNWVSKIAFSPDGKSVCVEAHNYFHCTDLTAPPGDEAARQPDDQPRPAFFQNAPNEVSSKNFALKMNGATA